MRVGSTGTCVDAVLDWTGVTKYHASEANGYDQVGEYVNHEGFTFAVRLESATGRFWYDDVNGY